MDDVRIGKGNLNGMGVYANRDFEAGETVIQYTLIPISPEQFESLNPELRPFVHTHKDQIYLYTPPECYVNHSDDPNTYQDLEAQRDIALRPIALGEAITTDSSKDDI